MKTKPHELELQPFQEWLLDTELTYASSSRERKRLVCTTNGTMKVLVAGRTVWQGMQPFSAIEAYNAITEKYVDDRPEFKL